MASPPFFGDFGKSVSDLLTKKFDFFHSLVTKNSEDNVKIESGVKCQKQNDGYSKFTFKDSRFGSVEGEVHTAAADKKTNGTIKFNKQKGLEVSLSGTAIPDAKLKAKYSQKNFNVEASVNTDFDSATIAGSAVMGFEGFALGGNASVDLSAQGANFESVDCGIQYSHGKSITAAVYSSKNLKAFTGSLFYVVNNKCQAGVSATMEGGEQNATLGVSQKLDAVTSVKMTVNTRRLLSGSIEHRLTNPQLAVTLAAQHDLGSGSLAAKKWGLGLTFGDY